MKLEIKKIGNSAGLILPRELLSRLGFNVGDEIFVVPDGSGGIHLSAYDPEFERSMQIVDQIMDEYRDTLRELAK